MNNKNKLARIAAVAVCLVTPLVVNSCATNPNPGGSPPVIDTSPGTLVAGSPRYPGRVNGVEIAVQWGTANPPYLIAYVEELAPVGPERGIQMLRAYATQSDFTGAVPISLGDDIPIRRIALQDAGSVLSPGTNTWLLAGSNTDLERGPVARHYWLWQKTDGVTDPYFTNYARTDGESPYRVFDSTLVGGSISSGGRYALLARGITRGFERDLQCVVAWIGLAGLPTFESDPLVIDCAVLDPAGWPRCSDQEDPAGMLRAHGDVLRCPASVPISSISMTKYTNNPRPGWLIAYVKNGALCVQKLPTNGGTFTNSIPINAVPGCLGGEPNTLSVSSTPQIREVAISGGSVNRPFPNARANVVTATSGQPKNYLLAFTRDYSASVSSLRRLFTLAISETNTNLLPPGIPNPKNHGITSGDLVLVHDRNTTSHWAMLDSRTLEGAVKHTRITRLGHSAQNVQQNILDSSIVWPFSHDIAFHPTSDSFGFVRPVVDTSSGIFGKQLLHTDTDSVVLSPAVCDASIGVVSTLESHLDPRRPRALTGSRGFRITVSGVPASVTNIRLNISPNVIMPGGTINCESTPDTSVVARLTPIYRPGGFFVSAPVIAGGTATRTMSISDRNAFPTSGSAIPSNTSLFFQWSWQELVVDDDLATGGSIRFVTRRSNVASVTFNP